MVNLKLTAMDHPQSRPHRESARPPIKYNPVPIGGPDRPPVTQSPSPGTIYASPNGDADKDKDKDTDRDRDTCSGPSNGPVNGHGSLKRELNSPHIKREPSLREDSENTTDRARSSIATRRSSTAYPDVINEETRSEDADGEPQKKRQKRNKPTLSCFECVERKTKVS